MNEIEQTKATETQTTAVEQNLGNTETQVSLGKFKSVNALLDAYNSLQAEFTKRCQRLKELEENNKVVEKAGASTETLIKEENAQSKEEILKEYLKEIVESKQNAVLLNGFGEGVKTPAKKPKTISEAGKLAIELLAK